jgi:hypothetical protein
VRDWRQKSDQNSIHVLIGISPNILRVCSKNNRLRATGTRKPLLAPSRSHSNRKAIGHRNWVRNISGNINWCWKEPVRDWRQKSDQNSIHVLIDISPNILRVCSKNNRLIATGTRKPRAFYPVAQEQHRLHPATIHTQKTRKIRSKIGGDTLSSQNSDWAAENKHSDRRCLEH